VVSWFLRCWKRLVFLLAPAGSRRSITRNWQSFIRSTGTKVSALLAAILTYFCACSSIFVDVGVHEWLNSRRVPVL
jgi:hypothetical protein